jgi:CBS domain containing-hemolysin-like protein
MFELYLVVGLVLVTSATCSLFEAVLYSVPASRVEMLEQAGRSSGRLLRELRQRIDKPIAAILSLNTIANTGGGALAGALAASALGEGNLLYFSATFTLAILLLSEVLPKTLGVVHADRLAPLIARPLRGLVVIFGPLVALTRVVTKLFWSGEREHRVTDEELLSLVGLGLRSGTLKPHEARVIENVLSMETRTAREIMTPRPVVSTLGAHVTTREAAEAQTLGKHSRIPVFDGDAEDLVGVVYAVDILAAVARDRFDVKVEEIMRPIHFAVDTTPLDQLLRTFLERRQHLVAVIDEFGGFAGIVTLEDVLEELIGSEIVDESDQVADLRAYAHRRREETLRRGERFRQPASGPGDKAR